MAIYLVTGGCGFIGSHLVDELVARGHGVRVLDNLSTGRLENVACEAEIVIGDILDERLLEIAMEDVSGCFHLAAVASVALCQQAPLRTHRVNLTGTLQVLEQARRKGGMPVIYASSAAVYGDPAEIPIGEDAPARPLSTYGADKLACELHAAVMSLTHGLPALGYRFFNVYGSRQQPGSPYSGVISEFFARARTGRPLVIHGDGGQVRDFIHVGDVVRQLVDSMPGLVGNSRTVSSGVYNLCTGVGTSISALAARIVEAAGTKAPLAYGPARQSDIRASIGDPRRAKSELGFEARMELKQGLREMAESEDANRIAAA